MNLTFVKLSSCRAVKIHGNVIIDSPAAPLWKYGEVSKIGTDNHVVKKGTKSI